jgi:hypothetical protein
MSETEDLNELWAEPERAAPTDLPRLAEFFQRIEAVESKLPSIHVRTRRLRWQQRKLGWQVGFVRRGLGSDTDLGEALKGVPPSALGAINAEQYIGQFGKALVLLSVPAAVELPENKHIKQLFKTMSKRGLSQRDCQLLLERRPTQQRVLDINRLTAEMQQGGRNQPLRQYARFAVGICAKWLNLAGTDGLSDARLDPAARLRQRLELVADGFVDQAELTATWLVLATERGL